MRRHPFALLLAALLVPLLSACASMANPAGPGVACDPCAQAEADNSEVGPGGQAAAAAATGGQKVEQAPHATDTARISPNTVVGRGAGPTESSVTTTEGRVVSNGAGVTQGLQVPTTAAALTGGSGSCIPQSVLQMREDIRALQKDAQVLLAQGQFDQYRSVLDTIQKMQQSLVAAEYGTATRITNIYNQQGQRVVQSVVSGNDAGSPNVPISEEGAKAAAGALTTGSKSVMEAPPDPAALVPASAPAVPEPSPLPPAGAPEPVR